MLLHATSIIFDACSQTSNFAQLLKIIRTKIVAKQIIWKTLKILKSKCFPISTKLTKYGQFFLKRYKKPQLFFFLHSILENITQLNFIAILFAENISNNKAETTFLFQSLLVQLFGNFSLKVLFCFLTFQFIYKSDCLPTTSYSKTGVTI